MQTVLDRFPGRRFAYFSMEIAPDPGMPTYSVGLGVLAGDLLRAAADLRLPFVAVTLVSRRGYFRQRLTDEGAQIEEPEPWDPGSRALMLDAAVAATLPGRRVWIAAWLYDLRSLRGSVIPVLLLDADLPV